MHFFYRLLPVLVLAASLQAQTSQPWPTEPITLRTFRTQGAWIPWPEGLSTDAEPTFEAEGAEMVPESVEVITVKGRRYLSASFKTGGCRKTTYTVSAVDPFTTVAFAGMGELIVGYFDVDRDLVHLEVGQTTTVRLTRFFETPTYELECDADGVVEAALSDDFNTLTITGLSPGRRACAVTPRDRFGRISASKLVHIRVVEKTPTVCTDDVNFVARVATTAGDAALLDRAGIRPGAELDCETDFSRAFTYLVCNGGAQGMSFILEQDGCIYRMSGHIGDDVRIRSNITVDGILVNGDTIVDLITSPNEEPRAEFTFEGTRKLDDDEARGTVQIDVFVTEIPARGGQVRVTVYAPGEAPIVLEFDGEPEWVEAVADSDPVFVPAVRAEQGADGDPILEGSGVILIRAEPNPNPDPREAKLTIAGQALTVTQLGTSSTVASVLSEGVVNGATFRSGITSNGWATLSGDFFLEGARVWGDSDFQGGRLPTQLDGVSVTVGGRPAFVQFANDGQINFLPDAGLEGIVDVQVATPDGGPGIPTQARAFPALPEFFRFSPLDQRYVAAVHPDGVFVGPADLFDGAVAMRPARPGDVIQIFGTGWGATMPPVDPGRLITQPTPLRETPVIRIDGEPATVLFGGVVGSGLYQFNVVVPEVPDGDAFVEGEVLGERLSKRAFVRVESR